ncbi:ABC transporter permease [Streptomyces sp. NPDC088719]|uniref:ABC transporter permease n=1 Tax=Streptomyces sp. NPDC088719 TaxID=3365872 RepID=UPI0038134C15
MIAMRASQPGAAGTGVPVHRRAGNNLRLAWRITVLNVKARLEYPFDFAVGILNGILYQTTVLLFVGVLLTRFPGLDSWTAGEVMLIASIRLLGHSVYVVTFDNLMQVPYLLRQGRFDTFMVRPRPVLFQVLTNSVSINALGDLLVAVSLFTAAQMKLGLTWSAGKVIFLLLALLGAILLEAAIHLAVSSLGFITAASESLGLWVEDLMANFGNYPVDIFPKLIRASLVFILPVAFLGYFPAAVVLGKTEDVYGPPVLALASPLAGFIAFGLAYVLWGKALKRYQGNGT